MTKKLLWSLKSLILGMVLTLFACQLPAEVVRTVAQIKRPIPPTQDLRSSASAPELSRTPYSGDALDTVYPAQSTQTTYPGIEGTEQLIEKIRSTEYPGIPSSYPGNVTQTIIGEEFTTDYPGFSNGTSYPPQSTTSPSLTQTLQLPAQEGTILGTRTPQGEGDYPYPGYELLPTNTSYPGAESSIELDSTQYPSNPNSVEDNHSDSATPSISSSPTTSLTGTTAINQTPADVSPTNTPRKSVDQASTPTSTVHVISTATPSPTFTPYRTPTPSVTPTPTVTRTPMPYPPWISSRLHATDPLTVKLASGKVQLVEFFAYWSGPCQAMAPILQGLEKEYQGRVGFVYLDIDNPANIVFKQILGYRMEPHFFLLDPQGKILTQWIGYVTVTQLRMAFDTALQ